MTKPYKSSFKMRSITTAAIMKNEIATEMKVTAAIKKREEWMSDGNKWDTITPGRVPPTGIKYMVVDVETHDWKDGGPRNGRIVEIAWMVFDRDMKCLESKQYLLKPHGYDKIAQKATSVHGIQQNVLLEMALILIWFLKNLLQLSASYQMMAVSSRIIWNTKTRSLSAISTKNNRICGVMLLSVTLGILNY